MLCYYCLPHFGDPGNFPSNPQDGGDPYVDDKGLGHVPCCGRIRCEDGEFRDTARQMVARTPRPDLTKENQ